MFKLADKCYTLSLFELCGIYKFKQKSLVKFPTFKQADEFWSFIGQHTEYTSSYTKYSFIRKPVIPYITKVVSNSFYAKKETNVVTKDELHFLFQGVKRLLMYNLGHDKFTDNLGNYVN